MKRLYFILMMAIAVMTQCLIKTDAQAQTHTKQRIPNSLYYWEYLPPGYTEEPTRKFPLLIFFHGNGERADLNDDPLLELDSMLVAGPPKEIKNGQTMCFEINNVTECFIVISPQLTKAYTSWGVAFPDKVLSHALTTYAGRIDESRIYLTGLSLGAIATLQYVQTTNKPLVDKVAAIAPMAGGKTGSNVCILRDRDIAVWAVHGENDENTGTPLSHMQTFINNLNACSPQPNPLAVLTIVDNAGHNVWDRAYRTDSTYYKPNVYEWLLKNATGSAGQRAPTAPYVNAGPDKSLAAGTTNVVLNGHVARNDGATATYLWTQEAGTATNLSGINSKNLTVNGLATGTYVFRLASTDSWGVTSTDDVTVTVAGSGGGSHSYIQLKAINGTASNAAGTRIELYSDAQQATGAKDPTPYQNGNTHLQFFVKSIQGTAPNLNSLQVGLKANSQNLYVVAGDYDLETTADGWTRVAIPISAWGFSASNWAVGVLNVGFKVVPLLGNGDIVFGIDEVHFTGGSAPYVWYGDANTFRGSVEAVFESSPTKFFVSARPTTGGLTNVPTGRMATADVIVQDESQGERYTIRIYDSRGQYVKSMMDQDALWMESLRSSVDRQGLYIIQVVSPSGKTEIKKVLFRQ